MSPFATLAIAACKRAIAAVKDLCAPCGFINKNPCSRFLRNATRSSAKRIAKESTPASWQRSGAVAIPWSAVWVVSSLPIGEIPLGKMSCADDLAGTAEAPHIADAFAAAPNDSPLCHKRTRALHNVDTAPCSATATIHRNFLTIAAH